MPIRPSKNVVGKFLELPTELSEEVERFATARGQTFKGVVIDALRRHLAYPPPPPVPVPVPPVAPLPDAADQPAVTEGEKVKPAPKPKKGKKA